MVGILFLGVRHIIVALCELCVLNTSIVINESRCPLFYSRVVLCYIISIISYMFMNGVYNLIWDVFTTKYKLVSGNWVKRIFGMVKLLHTVIVFSLLKIMFCVQISLYFDSLSIYNLMEIALIKFIFNDLF